MEIDATPMTDYMRMIFKKVLDTTNVESLTGQEKEKLSIAKSLKNQGIPIETIAVATNLSKEIITKLQ